jgi:hypothetical protein
MEETSTSRSGTFRTIEAKVGPDSLIKPGELVDLVEMTPLTLSDRRIYNLLLENAWENIDKAVVHTIGKACLRGNHNSNDRIGESIERLMSAIVKVKVVRDGETLIERVQLLGGNIEHKRHDGTLVYEIPARLRRIIKDSTIFARLQKEVMFALSSKYALTLYEMVQKRGNLSYRSSEDFTLDEFRGILGVPKGKLTSWSNLLNRAIKPAIEEVNQLSGHLVELQPLKTGRQVSHVRLKWLKKDLAGVHSAVRELATAKVGRVARRERRVEAVFVETQQTVGGAGQGSSRTQLATAAAVIRGIRPLRSDTYETARLRHPGYDIYYVEQEWREWAKDKESPYDADRAFLAFFRTYAANNPL